MPEASEETPGCRGRAMSLAVHEFQGAHRALPFPQEVLALRTALTTAGYTLESHDGLTASELGAKATAFLKVSGPGPRILHVLSHGVTVPPAERLHIVGACGGLDETTDVERWSELVETYHPDRPYTLLVLDLCHAGQAAWPEWIHKAAGFDRRVWVIGACEKSDNAYNARLTRAFATFLTDLCTDPASLGLDAASPHVPFARLVEGTRARVDALASAPGASEQRVTATPYDGQYPDLPFFDNPLSVSQVVQWDEILDFGHWQRASTGQSALRPHRPGVGFVGRSQALRDVAEWLDATMDGDPALPWLCLITGRRGSGKSALLGVLVCATHEDFDKTDDRIWLAPFGAHAPSRHGPGHMAAVHARRRGLTAILGSMARQLRVEERVREGRAEFSPARSLCEAIRGLPLPPVVVMDAVDEAENPSEVVSELILPLSERRPDGTPLAYCLVGVRDEEPASPLYAMAQESGLPVDLEKIHADTLNTELHAYVSMLLRTDPYYADTRFSKARPLFAQGMAAVLSQRLPQQRGGEFLISGLYTHHILSLQQPAFDATSAEALGGKVPRDLAGVLDLDLATGAAARPLRRPLLTALAHTRGTGMPVSVVRSVARLFMAEGTLPGPDEIQQELDREGHYLRVSTDTDGTLLYRLYNQGLDDYLRSAQNDIDGECRHTGVLDAVLASRDGLSASRNPAWSLPYVRRHAAQHAADEGRLPDILVHPGFLVHADADALGPLLTGLLPRPADPRALLLRTSPARIRDLPFGARRQLLALEAMRWGLPDIAHEVLETPAVDAAPARTVPLWATGTNLDTRQLSVFSEHVDAVDAVVVLELDGRPVSVSAGADGTIRVADITDGSPVGEPLTGLTSQITALTATTLDGTEGPVLITGSANGPVHLWDLATGQIRGEPLLGHSDRITALTTWTAPEGTYLVTGSADATVRLWHLPDGTAAGEPLTGHTDEVTALTTWTAPEGTYLVTGSADATVRLWHLPDGTPAGEPLTGHTDEVTALTTWTAPEGTYLVTGSADATVRLWHLPDGTPDGEPRGGHEDAVTAVAVLPSDQGAIVFSADAAGRIHQWSPDGSPANAHVLRGHMGAVTALATGTAAPHALVSASDDGTVRTWNVTAQPPMREPAPNPAPGHDGPIRDLAALTTNGQVLAVSGGADRTIRLWSPDDGAAAGPAATIAVRGGFSAMDCCEQERLLVTGTANGAVHLHGADDGTLLARLGPHPSPVTSVRCALVGGAPRALVTHQDGVAQMWDLRERKPTGTLRGHRAAVTSVSFFGTDPLPTAVTAGYDRTVRLWDLATYTECGLLPGHSDAVTAVDCTMVGSVATGVTACADGSVRLWDLEGRTQSGELAGHTGMVTSVTCASVDEVPTVVTTCQDGTVRLWDLTTRRLVEELVFPEPVHRARWLTEGRLLFGFGRDVAVFSAGGLHTHVEADED
ncbi:hypothetical protein [Streptomyces sp. NPDC005017]|uniref:hypothetical protein n=1 Tax=Streptomyces sp. NPDC005017 TaxID=3364706 RepID=UPI00368F9C4F